MGTWGAGSFENDDVHDWFVEFMEEPGVEQVSVMLETIIQNKEHLDAGDAQMGVGAAEVVAAMRGRPMADLPEPVAAWVTDHRKPEEQLLKLAYQAVERIQTDSELKELWEEGDSGKEWHDEIDNLKARLEI